MCCCFAFALHFFHSTSFGYVYPVVSANSSGAPGEIVRLRFFSPKTNKKAPFFEVRGTWVPHLQTKGDPEFLYHGSLIELSGDVSNLGNVHHSVFSNIALQSNFFCTVFF